MNEPKSVDKLSVLRLAFSGISDEELHEMAALTDVRTYPPQQVLCHEGAFGDIFYIIAEGQAEISKKISDQDGERILQIAGSGDLVGEMALIQNAPRSATVRTITACTVLEMDKGDFETILSRSPRMAINIIRITLDRMRENDQMAIKELQNTNKILHLLDRNKLEFIQVAAHELRTPLTVVKGYVNLLNSFPELKTNDTLVEVMDGIIKGADRMHEVVNTMLDVSRIDTDTLKIHAVPVLLKRMIEDIAGELAEAASERKIELILEHQPGIPTINGDPTLIQKAIYHLIVNAIKYTPDGGRVILSTRPITFEKNEPGVEISVRDTGIGLDPEQHELIFEKFYQVGDATIHSSGKTTFKGGGPGLGLAIVRGVARAHGGKTWVESSGNDETRFPGSTFFIQLPVNPLAG